MGLTYVTTQVRNLMSQGDAYEASFLVDTGAIHCSVPGTELRRIGVQVEGRSVYELANGQPVVYEFGFARIKILGEETVVHVLFSPDEAEPLLGVVALENLGIVVDPQKQTLRRLAVKPLK